MEDIRTAPGAVDLTLFVDLFDAHAADIVTRLNEEDADTPRQCSLIFPSNAASTCSTDRN